MGEARRKEIKYYLPEKKIDELLRAAEDARRKERLGFLKNLYQCDTIAEAADREGQSAATGCRWVDAWNVSPAPAVPGLDQSPAIGRFDGGFGPEFGFELRRGFQPHAPVILQLHRLAADTAALTLVVTALLV